MKGLLLILIICCLLLSRAESKPFEDESAIFFPDNEDDLRTADRIPIRPHPRIPPKPDNDDEFVSKAFTLNTVKSRFNKWTPSFIP